MLLSGVEHPLWRTGVSSTRIAITDTTGSRGAERPSIANASQEAESLSERHREQCSSQSEPEVAATGVVGQAFMIETEQVKDRRVEVMHMDFIFENTVGGFTGSAVGETAFDAASSEKDAVSVAVVFATDFAGS